MKVSIITVCLNSAATIEETIRSVINQDYLNIEYIVVDGNSTDNTAAILYKYNDKISKQISEPDNGIYQAMNKGINLSTGEIIGFLNADDIYTDETIISEVVSTIQQGGYEAVYGDLVYIDPHNTDKIIRYWQTGKYVKGAFRSGWVIPHPTFFCRRDLFNKYGCFNEQFEVAADFELALRFIEKHQIKLGYIPKVLVKMRAGGKANILRGIIRGNREIIRSFRINNLSLSLSYFILKPISKFSQFIKRPQT